MTNIGWLTFGVVVGCFAILLLFYMVKRERKHTDFTARCIYHELDKLKKDAAPAPTVRAGAV